MVNICTRISVLLFAAIALTSCGGGGGGGNLQTLEDLTGDPCDNPYYAAEPGNNCPRVERAQAFSGGWGLIGSD